MITTPQEYYEKLAQIDELSKSQVALLMPHDERIYNIDLNARTIDAPEFLSVEADHRAETIYFLVDRFYDNVDLSTTNCIIHYINADGEARVYPVPFLDIETFSEDNKMLIPWLIEGAATKAAGKVTYAVKFFKIIREDNQPAVSYELNTLLATSQVLHGMDIADALHEFDVHTFYEYDEEGNPVLDGEGNPVEIKEIAHSVSDFKELSLTSAEVIIKPDLLYEVLDNINQIIDAQKFNIYWRVLE